MNSPVALARGGKCDRIQFGHGTDAIHRVSTHIANTLLTETLQKKGTQRTQRRRIESD
jgi:hypothetical protein